ncbi:hypothetical protein D9M69_442100 [compost metagenome]
MAGRHPELDAFITQANGQQIVVAGNRVGLLGKRQAQGEQGAVAAAEAEALPVAAFVAEAAFGEHRVLLQLGELRLDQFGGHRQQVAVAIGEDAKARQHAALGRAAGAQAAVAVVQVGEVAGQLTLEEFFGFGAADGEDALMGQGAEECGVGHWQSLEES